MMNVSVITSLSPCSPLLNSDMIETNLTNLFALVPSAVC